MKQPTLGVHMIIRNEEARLANCLASIQSIADEIIVVDTGSTDRSMQIAKQFGAVVVCSTWKEDFAKARNEGISLAGTDWILVLDADEELTHGQNEIKAFLQGTSADVCTIQLENWTGLQPENRTFYEAERVFRNRRGFYYKGIIHEQLVGNDNMKPEGASEACIGKSPIRVQHYGYLPAVLQEKQTARRNLGLIQKALELDPKDTFHLYNLGVTCCQLGMWEQAKEAYKASLRDSPLSAPYRATLVRDLAKLLHVLELYDEGRALLLTELLHYSDYAELHVLLGMIERSQGMMDLAYASFQAALEVKPAGSYVTDAGMNSYVPQVHMADIDKHKERWAQAEERYSASLEECPGYVPAVIGLADLLHLQGEKDTTIAQRLLQLMMPTDPILLYKAAHALSLCGAYEAALSVLPEDRIQASDEAWVRLCLMQTERYPWAAGRAQQQISLLQQAQAAAHGEAEGEREAETETLATILDMAVMDWSLSEWRIGARLPEALVTILGEQSRVYLQMEARLFHSGLRPEQSSEGGADPGAPNPATEARADEAALSALAVRLCERAAECGWKQLVLQMKAAGLITTRQCAGILYRSGYRWTAADQYLELLAQDQLDADGAFELAELLYDQKLYAKSAALFDRAIQMNPQHQPSRAGAAASYLQLAYNTAVQTLNSAGQLPGASQLQSHLRKLGDSTLQLMDLGWQTRRSGRERRNEHV
ncbi:TPR domain-containing glycosyltransferase [Paenibacillus urinalis]|uniref:Glycosyltransferase n=1 Tax=Paenibacillus urinalis TaxID=521520 RepID=A0AAX3MYX7_9BACL|nr:TPR domain-containing glycosyltransferase [Paenibacillus urinalis]WDH82487.1 glycosyltransferase [Paenibacillus urinalis]